MRRILLVLCFIAALMPSVAAPAGATHDGGACSERQNPATKVQGYIPVAQGTPDATTLHYQLLLPKAEFAGPGPYHAVIDYSGYQPGITIYDGLHRHFLCQGYAVIGLNIRGTGCSGGKFDYFEPRQAEDGREAIEWFHDNAADLNLSGRMAMVGKSYPGITQLFVAGQPLTPGGDPETPEGLVAIVPGAVFGDLYRDVPFPGGIMNVTFAAGWSAGRIYEPLTAPFGDHEAIQKNDQDCIANAAQHAQNPPFNPFVKALYNQYDGELFHERSPWYWADNIDVPTFLFETWQDEQVGSRATELTERFAEGLTWRALFTNGDHGGHGDYYGGHVMPRIDEFLRFYLAQQIPERFEGGTVTTDTFIPKHDNENAAEKDEEKGKGTYETRPETYEEALARYEAEPRVQVNWENGAGAGGDRVPTWISYYEDWPAPEQVTWRLNMTPDGTLVAGDAPQGDVSYRYQPGSSQQRGGYMLTDLDGNLPAMEGTHPASWNERPEDGTYVMFETAPLESDKLLAGSASVDLTVSSTAADTDLQVTLTEVRPDGQEVFVNQGWLRASHRKLDPELSTDVRPFQTHQLLDGEPLVPGTPTEVRIEIFPFAHPFRAGSQLRVYVEAPHVKPDLWGFALLPAPAVNTIHTGPGLSSVALPLLEGEPIEVQAYPACTLRNQPCRELQ
ncbi:MAG: CocE/NonD family hydrolase [Actinomycetota bacterium]